MIYEELYSRIRTHPMYILLPIFELSLLAGVVVIALFNKTYLMYYTILTATYFLTSYLIYRFNRFLFFKPFLSAKEKLTTLQIRKTEETHIITKEHVLSPDKWEGTHCQTVQNIQNYRRVLQHIDPSDKVLDVGCKSGRFTIILKQENIDVVGLDFNVAQLRETVQLKSKVSFPPFVIGDAERLPFKDESFNKVICIDLLEHLLKPHALLEESKRLLKPNGVVILITPSRHFPGFTTNPFVLAESIISLTTDSILPCKQDWDISRISNWKKFFSEHGFIVHNTFTIQHLRSLIKESNLKLVSLHTVNFHFPLYFIPLINASVKNYQRIIKSFEYIFERIPVLKYLGKNWIIVCKKNLNTECPL